MIKQLIDAKPARARLRSIIMSCAHGWPALSFSVWQSGSRLRQAGGSMSIHRATVAATQMENHNRAGPVRKKPLNLKIRNEENIQEIHGAPVCRWLNKRIY